MNSVVMSIRGLPSLKLWVPTLLVVPVSSCYASQQTYVKVNDTYSEGGTHEETLHPQSKTKVMNKRRGD